MMPAEGPLGHTSRPRVAIVVPTYREVESLPHLIDRVGKLRETSGI
jgi:hypothetical protein